MLHDKFPGGYRQSTQDYRYYLTGDIFQSGKLILPFSVQRQLEETALALGEFTNQINDLPNPADCIRAYINKEATQSSRIEDTQASIQDAFTPEENIMTEKRDDWHELNAYIRALNGAVTELHNLPLCNRLIKQTHKILLSQARGKNKLPGTFRQSQNWIGGSRPGNAHFVPTAHEHIDEAMGNLEKFIHDETLALPHLVKAALIHCQFETIHPFLDGNGRIGRMLIVLYLLEKKILQHPILYISDYFESNRRSYYDMLDRARENQEGLVQWISFFLDAVITTARQGTEVTGHILALRKRLENDILKLGRRAQNSMKLLALLFKQPVINTRWVKDELAVNTQTAHNLINNFVNLGIIAEMTGYKRNRMFIFEDYIHLLTHGAPTEE